MGSCLFLLLLSVVVVISTLLLLSPPARSDSAPSNVSHHDRQALLGLKRAIDPNNSLANWTPSLPFCNWTGITCSFSLQRVLKLNVSYMGLVGTLSPLVGNLSALESLDISNNLIHGHIPPQLGQLSNAKELLLHRNDLEGSIPASLSSCHNLVLLTLSFNKLQGNVPVELAHLTRLQILALGANSLIGTIPSSFGNLSALTILDFSENNLIGPIPTELGRLTHLQLLYLHTNQLSGPIPSSIGNLSSLTDLQLATNNFIGPIPIELGKLTQLQILQLFKNNLSGPISTSLLNCTALINLDLNQNQISGHIPQALGTKLVNLQILSLWRNQLIGDIPKSIGNCSKLEELHLNYNLLSGMVPIELGKLLLLKRIYLHNNHLGSGSNSSLAFLIALTNCSHLEELAITQNHLTGVLPSSIGRLSSKLFYLDLAQNKIGGSIPKEISNLINLTYLRFNDNLLRGHIPSEIGRLHKLERLVLSRNNLYGTIPNEIGKMQGLGLLDVSWNNLTGRIPNSLGSLKQLRRLFLHHNQFSGEIPASLKNIPNLELLDFSYNDLSGRIPREVMASLQNLQFYLNLSRNILQGSLPVEISKIVNTRAIDISGNHLDGGIPGALANCIALEHLNLSHNAFEGLIPDALGKLQNLQNIDLSFNFLSGQIPEKGLFNNNVTVLLMGNPNLCGPKKYFLHTCSKQGKGKHLFLTKTILAGGTGIIVFILCSLTLGILWHKKISRKNFDFSNFRFARLGYPKFTYQDLVIATNGFDERNLLGSGNFGLVYKGVLKDGKIVAIKVLNLQNDQGQNSFKTECKVLGKVRHRNLIGIISACSYLEFKCLVLQFASKGSLEKHLYPNNNEEDVCDLGLSECLNIAIDVANAMEYLHYDCPMQVVHCDLKPSNVLLDEDMTVLVTDFGISRLVSFSNSMDSLSRTPALRGSIGYIAPEYGLGENVSIKGDVYSYGILLLEIVTRKTPTNSIFVEDLNLQKWVRLAFPNMLADIVDSRLMSSVNSEQYKCLVSFIHLGLLCTNESPQERPTMRDVRRALESLRTSFMESASMNSNFARTISDLVRGHHTRTEVDGMSESQTSTY